MSEVDANPTDNEALSGGDAQQLTGNESSDQHAPSTLEKVRTWTREHPLTVAVGSVATGAVITGGALTLGSSEEKQGTTITTTQKVENPDGSREVTVEETFIPEESSPTPSPSPNQEVGTETSYYNTVEGGNPDEFYEYEKFMALLFEKTPTTSSYIEEIKNNFDQARSTGDYESNSPSSFKFWRGAIVLSVGIESDGDVGTEDVYARLENPIEIETEEGDYWAAYNPLNGAWVDIPYTVVRSQGELIAPGFKHHEFWKHEDDEFSGQVAQSTPLSIDEEGLLMHDNFDEFLRGEVDKIRPVVRFYKTYESATTGLSEQVDTSEGNFPDSVYEDYNQAPDA